MAAAICFSPLANSVSVYKYTYSNPSFHTI